MPAWTKTNFDELRDVRPKDVDGEVVELSASDVLRVAPTVVRSFEAGPPTRTESA
jgi:hypothetical protein